MDPGARRGGTSRGGGHEDNNSRRDALRHADGTEWRVGLLGQRSVGAERDACHLLRRLVRPRADLRGDGLYLIGRLLRLLEVCVEVDGISVRVAQLRIAHGPEWR